MKNAKWEMRNDSMLHALWFFGWQGHENLTRTRFSVTEQIIIFIKPEQLC